MKLAKLYQQKQKLARRIQQFSDIMRGSMVVLKKPCTNARCQRCKAGIKHPTLFYSITIKGKTKLSYFPKVVQEEAKRMVKNYRNLKVLVDKLSLINAQILLTKARKEKRCSRNRIRR